MYVNSKAPPVYKPTPVNPAKPPVFCPKPAMPPGVQLKAASRFKLETRPAPPVCRLGGQTAINRSPVKPPAIHWPPPVAQFKLAQAKSASRVIQRMYYPNMTTSVPNLDTVSRDLSASHGYRETATFAVVNDESADFAIFGQRYYKKTNNAAPTILNSHGIGVGIDYVTPDASEEHVHAEMLAVSEWLKGNRDKPEMIGASRIVCKYCAIVLKYLGITIFSAASDEPTQNWSSPWYLNDQENPLAIKSQIPKYRKKGRDYY